MPHGQPDHHADDRHRRETHRSDDSSQQPDAENASGESHLPFIEQVLSQTEGVPGAADLDALKQVAVKHRGRELTADPIGIELVCAILESRFPRLRQTPAERAEMAEQIATAIFEADELQDRLENFWNQLCDSV